MGESETGTKSDGETRSGTGISEANAKEYWRRNVKLIAGLFVVWFVVSFLVAIILAEPLSTVNIGAVPLPFWFAQQGSVVVFVALIWIYVWRMNKLDREFGVQD